MHRLHAILLFSFSLFFIGCNKSKETEPELVGGLITGKILDGGKPLKLLPEETVRISFISVEGNGKNAGSTEMKEDGSFTINGPAGKGLPAGKWKVTLNSEIYGGGDNRFADKFDSEKTPFTIDLAGSGTENFEIDIRTRKITKK